MKKQLFLLILSSVTFFGCKESAIEFYGTNFYFMEPQPINDSELKKFPSKFRGVYQSDNNDIIEITDNYIYRQYEGVYTVSRAEFDSISKENIYEGGKLKFNDNQEVLTVQERHDSVTLKSFYRDTIFAFSQNHKAKRINGHLVLSHKDSVFWKVNILAVKNDSLKWKKLGSKTDYAFLKSYIKDITSNADTSVVKLKPTRREFSKLLSSENINWSRYYKSNKK